MTSTRIRGRKLALTLGTPPVDYWQDVTTWTLAPEELDGPTFGDVAAGASLWRLTGSAIQSTDAASFWMNVWENSGQRVAYTVAPHGNAEPSTAQPHYIGFLTIGRKPSLGGEAGSRGYTFDFDFEVDGEPLAVTE